MYPSALNSHIMKIGDIKRIEQIGSAFYGYVLSGKFVISTLNHEIHAALKTGAYFALNNYVVVQCEDTGVIITIERMGYQAMQQVGMIEKTGRLSYIDDCSDSILCAPARLGDPCLNHLHFPKGILQAQHTHPSIRLGIIARGKGKVWGPDYEKDLLAGDVFCIEEGERHSFKTDNENTMDVIAFHPDSDWGPTDTLHPMLNRTYLVAKNRYGTNN